MPRSFVRVQISKLPFPSPEALDILLAKVQMDDSAMLKQKPEYYLDSINGRVSWVCVETDQDFNQARKVKEAAVRRIEDAQQLLSNTNNWREGEPLKYFTVKAGST